MILASGVDLIEIDRFNNVRPALLKRFLARIYTPAELAEAGGSQPSLAGLFAAKEAVAKALGTGIGLISWQEIEILSSPDGEPRLQLHGNADKIAQQKGLAVWSISISHSRTHAVALAVAIGDPEKA